MQLNEQYVAHAVPTRAFSVYFTAKVAGFESHRGKPC